MQVLDRAVRAFQTTITTCQATSLQSQERLYNGKMGRLPDHQWHRDVTHWWATMLSSLQATFVSVASGQIDPELDELTVPTTPHMREMCENQVRPPSRADPVARTR